MPNNDITLRRIFADICQGYSSENWNGNTIFVKHLSNIDYLELDSFYQKSYDSAIKKLILTEKQKLKWLEDNKLWTRKDESDLLMQKDFVETMIKTKDKLISRVQKEQVQKDLEKEEIKLNEIKKKKNVLIGLTAEQVADQKMQYYYIHLSFFKNEDFKEKFFKPFDLDNMDDEDSYELIGFYINTIRKFDTSNIKKISISNYFTNIFYLCGENMYNFFNKPLYKLTNYQTNLLSYGLYYKNIFQQNPEMLETIKTNPDQIEEFVKQSKNLKNALDKVSSEHGRVGMVGVTKEDFESMGLKSNTDFLKDEKGPLDAYKTGKIV